MALDRAPLTSDTGVAGSLESATRGLKGEAFVAGLRDFLASTEATASNLTTLDASSRSLSTANVVAVCELLASTSRLEVLKLDGNEVAAAGAAALGRAFPKIVSLRVLSLRQTKLGAEGGTALAEGIMFLKELTELDLTDSGLGDAGTQAIARVALLPALRVLRLGSNGFGDATAAMLPDKLAAFHRLTTLDLSRNRFTPATGEELVSVLRFLRDIESADFSGCDIGDNALASIALFLTMCPNLRQLGLRGVKVSAAAAAAFEADAKRRAPHLDVAACGLQIDGSKRAAETGAIPMGAAPYVAAPAAQARAASASTGCRCAIQ